MPTRDMLTVMFILFWIYVFVISIGQVVNLTQGASHANHQAPD